MPYNYTYTTVHVKKWRNSAKTGTWVDSIILTSIPGFLSYNEL